VFTVCYSYDKHVKVWSGTCLSWLPEVCRRYNYCSVCENEWPIPT